VGCRAGQPDGPCAMAVRVGRLGRPRFDSRL
jgi:hypothetical protein